MDAYRSGDFPAADELARHAFESASLTWENLHDVVRALSGVISSLALTADGRIDEAEAALIQAKELIAGRLQFHPDGSIIGSSALNENGDILHDVLIAEILIREAEAALE